MMSKDTELLKLCKEVYERTGWDDVNIPKNLTDYAKAGEFESTIKGVKESLAPRVVGDKFWHSPRYTSDYLLEKLPYGTSVEKTVLGATAHVERSKEFFFGDGKGRNTNAILKALLKLVIALDDAKELK